jgi:hypothetical protein
MAAGAMVADGVVNEIARGLFEQRLVAVDEEDLLGNGELQRDTRGRCDGTVPVDDARDEGVQVDRRARDVGLARLEPSRAATPRFRTSDAM